MEKSNVYIVNHAGHDFEKAKQFGELVYLTQNIVNVFATDRIEYILTKELDNFKSDKDYLLLSGAIILNILAVNIVLKKYEPVS